MDLALRRAGADRPRGDEVRGELRRNRIEELRARGKAELDQVEQEPAGEAEALVDGEGAVEVRIVDESLPADRRARLLEVDAHHETEVAAELVGRLLQTARVVEPGRWVVDGAGGVDDEQARVHAGRNANDLLTSAAADERALLIERQLLEEDRRREQRPDALDVEVAGFHRSPIVLEREAEAGVHQARRADRDDALARAAGRVRLVEEVLDPDEGLGPPRERTRDEEVQDDVASERQRIQVVLELAADVPGRRRDGGDRRVGVADAEGDVVLGDLGEPIALEEGLLRRLDDARVAEEVTRDEPPLARQAELELALEPADAREIEVLALAAGRARRAVGQGGRQGDVRHEVAHLVPERRDTRLEGSPALLHARLAAGEALGTQVLVRDGDIGTHAEDAVELVEGRDAEALVRRGAHVRGRRRVEERGDPRAREEAVDVGERLARRYAASRRRRRVTPGAVVAPPVVAADAPDQLPRGMGRVHVLDEDAADELLAPRDARAREGAAHVDLLLRLAVDPADVAAARHQVRAEAAVPLEVAAGRGGGDRLVEREGLGIAVGGLGGVRAPV